MTHTYYENLRGITLPGKLGIVTGRVHTWLKELSDDIAPVSCWVISVGSVSSTKTLSDFFVNLAIKLQENAGVNVVLDGIEDKLSLISAYDLDYAFVEKDGIVCITPSVLETRDIIEYKVADSLQLKSAKSKEKYPRENKYISIYESWIVAWDNILKGKRIKLDFNSVREQDDKSTGKESFIALLKQILELLRTPTLKQFLLILSEINSVIKRGGFRKHGAVTTSLRINSLLYREYLEIPFADITHVKKAVSLPQTKAEFDYIPLSDISLLVSKYADGELFIEKYLGETVIDGKNIELRSNVCRGITLSPGDQCLISHVNLGQIKDFSEISVAYKEVTTFLLNVWKLQEKLGFKLLDRQIAAGVVGLANLLRNHDISYSAFIDEQTLYLINPDVYIADFVKNHQENKVKRLIVNLAMGMKAASDLARLENMRAIHTIEPSESCARRYKDFNGNDLVPQINPPNVIPGVGIEHRHSQTGIKDIDGNEIVPVFAYGEDIETLSNVPKEKIFTLWDNWQQMMEIAGLAHMACYENFGTFDINEFIKWYNSHMKTLYYHRPINSTEHLDKGNSIKDARAEFNAKFKTPEYCESCSEG